MSEKFYTIVVSQAQQAAAQAAAANAHPQGVGMFISMLSPPVTVGGVTTWPLPATHYINSGFWDESITAALAGLVTFVNVGDVPVAEQATHAATVLKALVLGFTTVPD